MRLRLSLLLPLLVSACGGALTDATDDGVVTPTTAPACARTPSAPLVAIDDVRRGSAQLGPCGDLAYEKPDGSVWLRTAAGESVELASQGAFGGFDATGTYAAFRRGEERWLRDLTLGTELAVPEQARFGLDPATNTPLVFVVDDGVRLVEDGHVGAPIPGTSGLLYREHASYGDIVMMLDDQGGALTFVDLVREAAVPAAVEFRSNPGWKSTGPWRDDDLAMSRDGSVALYAAVTWTACGDTACPEGDGFDILDAHTGEVLDHGGAGHAPLAYAFAFDEQRANSLVDARGNSIDTKTGAYVARDDASLVRLQENGTLVLSRSDRAGTRVTLGHAGQASESTWLTTATPSSSVVAWPSGRRSAVLEPAHEVKVSDGAGTWGGAEYGDLVLRDDDGAESSRVAACTSVNESIFPGDGSAVLAVVRYPSSPPAAVASSDELGLVGAIVKVAPDGSSTILAGDERGSAKLFAIDERSFAAQVDGSDGRSTLRIYDVATGAVRAEFEAGALHALGPAWAAPTGVLAAEEPLDDTSTLWHGVPAP